MTQLKLNIDPGPHYSETICNRIKTRCDNVRDEKKKIDMEMIMIRDLI